MNDLHCLSVLEILDLREGHDDGHAAAHVASCVRCGALQRDLIDPGEHVPDLPLQALSVPPRPTIHPATVATGQLWRATTEPLAGRSWIVALLQGEGDGRYLSAPVNDEPWLATGRDIELHFDVLGYPAFLDIANAGTIHQDSLLDCVALLDESTNADTLRALNMPQPDDPLRNDLAMDRHERLALLWIAEDEPRQESPPATQTLGTVIHLALSGDEWDRSTLLEQSGVSTDQLDNFARDRLDLTDRRDVTPLAAVIHTLDIPWEDARSLVQASLENSPGGGRLGTGETMPMAARSRPGASIDETTRDLFADQSEVDQSEVARTKAIQSYLADLEGELDDRS